MKEFEDILEEINHNLEWCDDAYQSRCYRRSHDEITRLRTERDALLARLAPANDEALVEIVAGAINDGSKNIARAAIAAIRPHIEAAERHKCVKAVETVGEKINVAHHERPEWEDGYLQGVHDAAAAIRSGK